MVSHAKRVVFIVGVRAVKVDMLVSCSRGGQLRVDKVADKTLCKLNNNNNNTKKRKGKPQSVAGVILVQKKEEEKRGKKKRRKEISCSLKA